MMLQLPVVDACVYSSRNLSENAASGPTVYCALSSEGCLWVVVVTVVFVAGAAGAGVVAGLGRLTPLFDTPVLVLTTGVDLIGEITFSIPVLTGTEPAFADAGPVFVVVVDAASATATGETTAAFAGGVAFGVGCGVSVEVFADGDSFLLGGTTATPRGAAVGGGATACDTVEVGTGLADCWVNFTTGAETATGGVAVLAGREATAVTVAAACCCVGGALAGGGATLITLAAGCCGDFLAAVTGRFFALLCSAALGSCLPAGGSVLLRRSPLLSLCGFPPPLLLLVATVSFSLLFSFFFFGGGAATGTS